MEYSFGRSIHFWSASRTFSFRVQKVTCLVNPASSNTLAVVLLLLG